jgi:hypothetical protein
MGRGAGYYISNPRWSSGKICAPGNPSLGLKRNILFLEISQGFPVYFVGGISDAIGAMGGPRGLFRVRRSYTPLAARVWA